MNYAQNSPLKIAQIRQLVARACYSEIAIAAGEWNSTKLEKIINDKEGDDKANRYRKMLEGIIPVNTTVNRITERLNTLGKSVDILFWRDMPGWRLLDKRPLSNTELSFILNSLTGEFAKQVRKNFTSSPQYTVFSNIIANFNSIEYTINELFSVLVIARFGDMHAGKLYATQARRLAISILISVIKNTPHLYTSWPALLELIFNSLTYTQRPHQNFIADTVIATDKFLTAFHNQLTPNETRLFPPQNMIMKVPERMIVRDHSSPFRR